MNRQQRRTAGIKGKDPVPEVWRRVNANEGQSMEKLYETVLRNM